MPSFGAEPDQPREIRVGIVDPSTRSDHARSRIDAHGDIAPLATADARAGQTPPGTDDSQNFDKSAWAKAWLEAMESGRLNPPKDVHDAAAWDTYWTNQLEVGAPDQGFADIMSSHDDLVEVLASRDVRAILCAGNGLSSEALGLALHGFEVTALDISAVAREAMTAALRRPDHPVSRIPEVCFTDDFIVFADAGQIAGEFCPRIHQTASHPPRGGGSLTFASGDLMNAEVCPRTV